MDTGTVGSLGVGIRSFHRRARRYDSSIPHVPGARLPQLSGHPAFGENLWTRPAGSGGPPRSQAGCVFLQEREVDTAHWPRPPTGSGTATRPGADSTRQHPRNRLLQSTGGAIMLMQSTIEKLSAMKLAGMAEALHRQIQDPE